jgi:flagellar biosynthetic protein FlhB
MAQQNNDDEQDRSLPASPRRLERAREEGRVARSRELATCLVLVAGSLVLVAAGPQLALEFGRLLRGALRFGRDAAFSASAPIERLAAIAGDALLLTVPLLGVLALAALAGTVAVGGWVFSGSALGADFNRMNPLRGLANLLSANSLVELCKAIAKAVLVTAVACLVFKAAGAQLAVASRSAVESASAAVGATMSAGFLALAASLALIAAIDVPIVFWRHARDLRMTHRELRDESRESEGDPQVRMRVRSMQREMARRRMMAAVPKADVVVTNPSHYSVALSYRDGMPAPLVVAKGAHEIALRIRSVAEANGVAVLQSPPLARALYRHAELGEPIPPALFDAVAQVLAWVYRLRSAARGDAAPPASPSIEVPPELAVEEDPQ